MATGLGLESYELLIMLFNGSNQVAFEWESPNSFVLFDLRAEGEKEYRTFKIEEIK